MPEKVLGHVQFLTNIKRKVKTKETVKSHLILASFLRNAKLKSLNL